MPSSPVPLVDLKTQYSALKSEIDSAVEAVMTRGDFILGTEVNSFEQSFAEFCGTDFAVGCASGTDALYLALRALDVGPGDEVILPAMTFAASAIGVIMCGARPVLVDVDPETALIDLAAVERAITENTKVLMPVHLYGQCMNMNALNELAARYDLAVVEDAAQAHGASDDAGNVAGGSGIIGCFSFYPGKNLGAYGDGGIVTTSDAGLADRIRTLRNWGSRVKYHHETAGMNSRLDTIQAAVLNVKLRYLESWNSARRNHAAAYRSHLDGLSGITQTVNNAGCVYHLLVIRVDDRDRVLQALHDDNIGAGIHYPFALHELGMFKDLGYAAGEFPVAEDWARRCLSFPIYPELPLEAVTRDLPPILHPPTG